MCLFPGAPGGRVRSGYVRFHRASSFQALLYVCSLGILVFLLTTRSFAHHARFYPRVGMIGMREVQIPSLFLPVLDQASSRLEQYCDLCPALLCPSRKSNYTSSGKTVSNGLCGIKEAGRPCDLPYPFHLFRMGLLWTTPSPHFTSPSTSPSALQQRPLRLRSPSLRLTFSASAFNLIFMRKSRPTSVHKSTNDGPPHCPSRDART